MLGRPHPHSIHANKQGLRHGQRVPNVFFKHSCPSYPHSPPLPLPLQGLRHGQRVPIEFFTFGERHRRKSSILHVNWAWCVVDWMGGCSRVPGKRRASILLSTGPNGWCRGAGHS